MSEVNYWTMKKDDLYNLYSKRELEGDPTEMSRKAIIEAIKEWDVKNPDAADAMSQPVFVAHSADDSQPVPEAKLERVKLAPDGKPLRKFSEPYMLIVFNYREENEPSDVQLGLNGDCRVIPKDMEVFIPQKFLSVIRDAVEIKTVKRRNPQTGKMMNVTRQVPRFSYTVLATGVK